MTAALMMFAITARHTGSYPLIVWWCTFGALSVALAATLLRLIRSPESISAASVIAWALLMRAVASATPAFFEDDYFRFLWDGYRTLQDGNPYLHAPAHFFSTFQGNARMQDVLSGVNYPQIATIYGPALQMLFAASAWVDPGAAWPWKLIVCAADMGLVWVLIRAFGAVNACWYALSPLAIHEIAVAMHPDALIGALLVLAVLGARRQRMLGVAICIGVAAAMKVHALLALPFLLLAFATWPQRINVAAGVIAVYGVLWLPFHAGFVNAWHTLAVFSRQWEFNPFAYALLASVLPASTARAVAAVIILGLVGWLFLRCWRDRAVDLPTTLVMAFGALLMFAPVINAWYLLWLLPLACGTRLGTRLVTPWVAAMMLPLSYLTGSNLGDRLAAPHQIAHGMMVIEFGVISIALAYDAYTRFSDARRRSAPFHPQRLTQHPAL